MNISFLKNLLLGAGDILKEGLGSSVSIYTKQDQSNVVTETDFKSEEYIRKAIIEKYPTHNILGEENGFENRNSSYTWIVDPLDGTSNFAAQLPWFGVLIALLEKQEIVLAGAYLPMSNELFYATKGGGAFKNDQAISISDERELRNLLCCYSMDFSLDATKTEHELEIVKRLVQSCRNIRSTNCLMDFCFTAEGKIGCAINQTMKIWDIAATQLILQEAGAKVTDIHGNDIAYIPSEASLTQNFTAVAASPAIHKKVMELIHA